MDGSAHRPGFNERPFSHKGVFDVRPGEIFYPRPQSELGCGHDLGLDSAHIPDDLRQRWAGGAPVEMVAVEAESAHLIPGKCISLWFNSHREFNTCHKRAVVKEYRPPFFSRQADRVDKKR